MSKDSELQFRRRCFKPTPNAWYPSYQLGGWYRGEQKLMLVEVSLLTSSVDGKTVVCVWGGDDDGRERIFKCAKEAEACFDRLLERKEITKSHLEKVEGFVQA